MNDDGKRGRNLKKKPRKLLVAGMLLGLTLLLTSCGIFKHDTNLYLLDQQDMVVLEKDQDFKAPFNGIYLSDQYVEIVMEAKVKEA